MLHQQIMARLSKSPISKPPTSEAKLTRSPGTLAYYEQKDHLDKNDISQLEQLFQESCTLDTSKYFSVEIELLQNFLDSIRKLFKKHHLELYDQAFYHSGHGAEQLPKILVLMSINDFNALPDEELKRPILVKGNFDRYQLWGCLGGEWALRGSAIEIDEINGCYKRVWKECIRTLDFKIPPECIKSQRVVISPDKDIFAILEEGHRMPRKERKRSITLSSIFESPEEQETFSTGICLLDTPTTDNKDNHRPSYAHK